MNNNEKPIIRYNSKLKEYAKDLRSRATLSERILWKHLKNKQILGYDFHRQKPFGEYIFDFYSYSLRLVIELDGFSHLEEEVKENDKRKEDFINREGFNILRFKDEEVFDKLDYVLNSIRNYAEKYCSERVYNRHTL